MRRGGDGDTGWHLSLLTPSHSSQVFTPSSAQRITSFPALARSGSLQTLGGCSVSGAEWPRPTSQSEAAILASGPIRGGHSPPYWQRETGVSVPCRDQWAAGPAWSESVPSQTQHGEALTHQPSHITRNIDHIHTCRQHSSRQCKQWA